MSPVPAFDIAAAHKFFAADCFNNAWTYIEKTDRTREDDEQREEHLITAEKLADSVTEEADRKALLDDLATIRQ